MKKRYSSFILIAFVAMISSCSKDPIISTHDKVGTSKVTYYPTFTLTGSDIVSLVQGSAFTDPGIKASAGGADIPVITTGTIDINTVGLYTLTYTATNVDGFSATASRTVVVIPSAEVPGVDLSGEYMTTGGTPNATITKVAPGVYFTTNCWGNGSTAIIPAYFISADGATAIVPLQTIPGVGRTQTTGPGTYVAGLISWEIVRLDFPGGALVRDKTWQKL
ncbi:MAG: DUF5011 domain-containing protein [Ginsengibacter sp.]